MKPLVEPGRFRIKQAAFEQLRPAAQMLARAWRESFPFDDVVFEQRESGVDDLAELWYQQGRQGAYFWVVVDSANDGDIVGVAQAKVSDDPAAPTPLELNLLYLLDVAKGSGIADRLLEIAIGDAPAHLWVLDGNDRAITFYQRHGFVTDGVRQQLAGALSDHHNVRMVRGLG